MKSKFQKKNKKQKTWRYHFTHVYKKLWLDVVRFLRYGARPTEGWKKWHIEVGVPPKKSIFRTEFSSRWDEKKIVNQILLSRLWYICEMYTIPKFNSLIQTLIHRSNIYYYKIYQREPWKNNTSTLHLEVWSRHVIHRYSINFPELQRI